MENGYFHQTRRSVLKTIGSAAALSSIGGVATGREHDEVQPSAVEGIRNYTISQLDVEVDHADGYSDVSTVGVFGIKNEFKSKHMENKYGEFSLQYHEDPMILLNVSDVSDLKSKLEKEVTGQGTKLSSVENGSIEVSYPDTTIVGTPREFLHDEIKMKEKTSAYPPEYNGPMYVYADDENHVPTERTAPINVAWGDRNGHSSFDVWTDMYYNGWDLQLPSDDRYIFYPDGNNVGSKLQDRDVGKDAGGVGFQQWHVRLWDIPNDENYVGDDIDYRCAGNAHHDPWDHDKIDPRDPDWKFSESREEVHDFYIFDGEDVPSPTSVTIADIGNDEQMGTHDGKITQVRYE